MSRGSKGGGGSRVYTAGTGMLVGQFKNVKA